MALTVPTWRNPFDISNPFENVYARIAGVGLDASVGSGRVVFNIHPNAAALGSVPLDQLGISLGEQLVAADPLADPPVEAVNFQTLGQFMADTEFAAAYAVIAAKLYAAALNHPRMAGATPVA